MPKTSLKMKVAVKGDEAAVAFLHRLGAKVPATILGAAWKSAYAVEREYKLAVSEGPLFARAAGGGAEGSIAAFVEGSGRKTKAGARAGKFYLVVHEEGRVITGRPYLHFLTRDGNWITTRQVTIPARKPAQFAAGMAEPTVVKIWQGAVDTLVKGS